MTDGSGLTFVHAAARMAMQHWHVWYLYDGQGRPRWYTIQKHHLKAGALEAEGVLLESSAPINIFVR